MNTRKFFGYGTRNLFCAIAVLFTLAFTVLSMTGCEDPNALPKVTLTSITAVYNGTAAIYPNTPRDSLKADLTVTAHYSDNTSETLGAADYTLSGTLAVGTRTITVTYKGKTTTFTVMVTAAGSGDITYDVEQSGGVDGITDSNGIVFTFSESIDSLNLTANDIVVGGEAGKNAEAELTGSGTTWTLAPITVTHAGTATVTITKTGIEAGTKHVTVYKAGEIAPTLTGITAVYNGTATIYPTTPLNDLKAGLTVKAQYGNGSENTLSEHEYTLSVSGGTLTVGSNTVTVSYAGETTMFTVTVTSGSVPGVSGKLTINNFPSGASLAITVYDYDGGITILPDITGVQINTQKLLAGSLGMVSASPASLIRTTSTSAFTGTGTYLVLLANASTLQTWYAPQVAFTNGCAELDFNALGLVSELPMTAGEFVAVNSITGVPATATVDTPLTLNGTVVPATATNKTISWSVVSGPATISGHTLNFTAAGTVTVKATITNGTASGTDYTENFTITVSGGGGTPGLAYELITTGTNANTYRVRKGSVTSGEVIIPATYDGLPVTEIGSASDRDGAFELETSITAVHIPASVTTIGQYAFFGCTGLTSITIPENVTSIAGFNAFSGCTGLTSIIIPAGVTSIGNYAFSNWTSSQTIYVAGHTSQAAADAAWGSNWRNSCNANIVYGIVSITRQPDKTVYVSGEPLDITGLVVTVINNNGSTETVTITTANITGFNSSAKGVQTLTVTYNGETATFTVTVFGTTTTYTVTSTSEWNTALTNISNGGGYQDYTINVSGNVAVPGSTANSFGTVSNLNVTLQGNGKLSLNSNGNMIRIAANQTLIIDSANLTMEGRNPNSAALVYVGGANAKLELRNGTISNNYRSGSGDNNVGGGVHVMDNGTFTMSGGTISGNTASYSGGGGGIGYGGGVCVGGGSRTSGTFIMSGGTISGNSASGTYGGYGGGVYVQYGTFTMTGGTISNNTISGYGSGGGGGVYVSSGTTFTMSGGTISGNTITSTNTYDDTACLGGGVFVRGTFRIVTGILYGSNEGGLSNTVSGARTNSGAALYNDGGTTQRGTFSIPGDITSEWNSSGTLSTNSNTIRVENGALQ